MSRMASARLSLAAFATVAALSACEAVQPTETGIAPVDPALPQFAGAEWSTPVNIGELNTSFNDQQAFLSRDQLTIYFSSNRPGLGALDIWMSRRASLDSPWEAPVNLGTPINGPGADFAPNLSIDGHLLFFSSLRPGGHGGVDIYMARRDDPNDDFGWGEPVNIGAPVNGPQNENAPFYLQNAGEGMAQLYFTRVDPAAGLSDIYRIAIRRTGELVGSESIVTELSDPMAVDAAVSIRRDGREVWLWSTRAGSVGEIDLWVSTRPTIHHPWSTPTNPGTPLNSTANDVTPHLSFDGRTLLFGSGRPGGMGAHDLWISTRSEPPS